MAALLQGLSSQFSRIFLYGQGVATCITATRAYVWARPILIEAAAVWWRRRMGLQSSRLPGTFKSVSILNVLMIFRAREMLVYFTNESCAAFFEADLPRLRLVLVRVAAALGQYLLASLAARFLGDMVRLFFLSF